MEYAEDKRKQHGTIRRASVAAAVLLALPLCGVEEAFADTERLAAVRVFADQVIEHGRDQYGAEHTPLFADRIDVAALEPAAPESNFAAQQNLLRTLTALSVLTGDEQYRDAAEAATRHMIEHHRSPAGLFYWGGYIHIDLETDEYVYGRNDQHSLRGHIPFYEFLWDVDADVAAQFIRAFWNAQVMDWERLEVCRRGGVDSNWDREMGDLWDSPFGDPEPFIRTERTLSFIHSGTDLIYAAGMLHLKAGEEGAWTWGQRLARQYVQARHPDTGLGVYQYNMLVQEQEPPEEGDLPTHTSYGDRAWNQFFASGSSDPEDEFYNPIKGERADDGLPVAREGWVLFGNQYRAIYELNAAVQLDLAERLGDEGRQLLEWTVDGLKAYAEHAYDAEDNILRPLWADGTDLTGTKTPRTGYHGSRGSRMEPREVRDALLLSFVRARRLSGDEALWPTARSIARGLGLGDIGDAPGENVELNMETDHAGAHAVLALLELAQSTENGAEYVELAEQVGANILEQRFHHGFFISSADSTEANVNALEPLALLILEGALQDRLEDLPRVPR